MQLSVKGANDYKKKQKIKAVDYNERPQLIK